jgi:hypothetical protein
MIVEMEVAMVEIMMVIMAVMMKTSVMVTGILCQHDKQHNTPIHETKLTRHLVVNYPNS